MKTIWKYEVPISDLFTLRMPQGAKLLDVQLQAGIPQLWALVDPSAPVVSRGLRLHGTGHDIADSIGEHVGSFQLRNGQLVFHLFDQGEGPWPL